MRNQDMMDPIYWAPTPKFGGGWIAHKSSKAPPAPDYEAAAEATAKGNLEMAKYTTEANRATQVDPWGQVTWKQAKPTSFDQAGYNRALDQYYQDLSAYNDRQSMGGLWSKTGKAPVMPDRSKFVVQGSGPWTQTTTLDPDLQRALDSQIAVQGGRSKAAEDLLRQVQGQISRPLDTSSVTPLQTQLPTYDNQSIQQLQANLAAREAALNDPNNAVAWQTSTPTYNGGQAAEHAQTLYGLQNRILDPNSAVAWRTDMPEYNDATVDRYSKAAFDLKSSMLNPQYQQDEERLRNQLALQGLSNTAEAYQTDVGNFSRSKNDAMNNLATQSLFTGRSIADSDYARQFNEIQANNALRGQQMSELGSLYNMADNTLNTSRAIADSDYARELGAVNWNNSLRGQQLGELEGRYNMANQSLLTGRQIADANYNRGLQAMQTSNALRAGQLSELTDLYNMPLNQLNSLLYGQQVQKPTFSTYYQQQNVAGPDYLSAAQNQYQADLAASNAKNASQGGLISGLGSLAGTAIGGYFGGIQGAQLGSSVGGSLFSDRRLKRNIVRIGSTRSGLGVYSYNYLWSETPEVGVMADEAEALFPSAVTEHWTGYKMVNYSLIG